MKLLRQHRSLLAAFVAVFQLALTGGGVADGWLESRGAKASGSHIEALGGTGCVPVHAHDCAVCQQLSSFAHGLPSNSAQLAFVTSQQHFILGHGAHLSCNLWYNNESLPRAPPSNLSA